MVGKRCNTSLFHPAAQPVLELTTSTSPDALSPGDSITLNCTVSQGYPPPNITWEHDDVDLKAGGNVMIVGTTSTSVSLLTLNPLKPGDEGQYTCIGRNSAGSDMKDVEINVLCKEI